MSSRAALKEAFRQTGDTPWVRKPSVFLNNLKEISPGIPPPEDPNPVSDLAFAVLNREAPLEQRRLHANRALDNTKRSLLTSLPTLNGKDFSSVVDRARTISNKVVTETVQQAESFTRKPQIKGLGHELIQVLNPHKATKGDRAVAAYVMFDVFQPYLVDRLLEIDIYNPNEAEKQYQQIRRDTELVRHFYHSAGPSIQFAAEGKSDLPIDEVAERLFALGPIAAKIIQGMNVPANMTKSEEAKWVAQMGKMFQEGIVPPTEKELSEIQDGLPEGLVYTAPISSAAIAHVLKVKTPDGEALATKVKRPGIEQAITDDVEMFTVLSQILSRYAEEHTKGTPLAPLLERTKHAIPFLLKVNARDLRRELDFTKEASTQRQAGEIFARHPGIQVPKVNDQYSDTNHITMERVYGTAIEKLPAHPDHIKNLMVLALKLWKNRSVLGIHGDMHDMNIKGKGDGKGSLVAYDWAKIVKLEPGFLRNIEELVVATLRKNPRAIARAYSKIQDQEYYQATQDEISVVVEDILQTLPDKEPEAKPQGISGRIKEKAKGAIPVFIAALDANQSVPNSNYKTFLANAARIAAKETVKTKIKKQANKTKLLPVVVVTMGAQHQSTLDSDYKNLLETTLRIANVAGKELDKPEYQDKRYRRKVLRRSFLAAVKEVYFTKDQNTQ